MERSWGHAWGHCDCLCTGEEGGAGGAGGLGGMGGPGGVGRAGGLSELRRRGSGLTVVGVCPWEGS